jgi:hypothetical protein
LGDEYADGTTGVFRHYQVWDAIAIHISGIEESWAAWGIIGLSALESAVAVT